VRQQLYMSVVHLNRAFTEDWHHLLAFMRFRYMVHPQSAHSTGSLRLQQRLREGTLTPQERERIKQQNKRLLVAAAAENRRWQQQYRKPTLSVPTLLELAEVALGEAYVKVCEDLRPEADYCGLAWTPSALDHNNEPCRITLKRPAVESWTDGDATRKKDSSGK
jgi:hypothetical protein